MKYVIGGLIVVFILILAIALFLEYIAEPVSHYDDNLGE
jgi:hypothetical protein